jgi:hypothetical protein
MRKQKKNHQEISIIIAENCESVTRRVFLTIIVVHILVRNVLLSTWADFGRLFQIFNVPPIMVYATSVSALSWTLSTSRARTHKRGLAAVDNNIIFGDSAGRATLDVGDVLMLFKWAHLDSCFFIRFFFVSHSLPLSTPRPVCTQYNIVK